MLKRLFDLTAASIGLLVLAPLLLVVALIVKLDSPGPVFFRQRRAGRHWAAVRIFKFRTMSVTDLAGERRMRGIGDSAVTRVGRVLRSTKLDELPQLINVVRGEMSLVGPRPELVRFAEQFRSDFDVILTVRPGITDPASLQFRHEIKLLGTVDPEAVYVAEVLPKKIALARGYVRDHSFVGDLAILAKTLVSVSRWESK